MSKIIILIIVLLMGVILNIDFAHSAPDNATAARLFARPLITGASVSANYGTASPGKRLGLRYTSATNIRTIAQGGHAGLDVLKSVGPRELSDRTVIIAMDLFFWDSVLPSSDHSVKTLHGIVRAAADREIPLVLGEIPELLPRRQPSRSALNAAIHRACREETGCYVLPLSDLHRQVQREGGLVIKGRKTPLRELVPDGLHLSEAAGEYLADRIHALLEDRISAR